MTAVLLCPHTPLLCTHADREISQVPSSSIEDTSSIGLEPALTTSFNLNTFMRALSPNMATIGFRGSTYRGGGGIMQFVTAADLPSCPAEQATHAK